MGASASVGPRVSRRTFGRIRAARRTLVIGCAAALNPWTVFLALTLPKDYISHHWAATWVGFDVILIAVFGRTVVLGLLSSPWAAVTAFASGVLLVCDAWFDVMTSSGSDRVIAIVFALLVELPLAVVFTVGTVNFARGAVTMPPE